MTITSAYNEHTMADNESMSTTFYHEDLQLKDTAEVLHYAIGTLETKRDKYLTAVVVMPLSEFFKKHGVLIVSVTSSGVILWFMFKNFLLIRALGQAIFDMSIYFFIGCFLRIKFETWIQDNSFIAMDKEVNRTIADNGLNIFGFDIDNNELGKSDLSNVQVFRDNESKEIVGLVVLKPLSDVSSDDEKKIIVQIGIMAASGTDEVCNQMSEEMLEWCVLKAQILGELRHETIYLQIHLLGLDDESCVFFSKNNFKNIKSYDTTDKFFASMMPHFKKHIFELEI